MKSIKYYFEVFLFNLVFSITLLVNREIPLRIRLFKRRILGFIIIIFSFCLLYYHMEYVFLEFAYSAEAGKHTIYEQVFQTTTKWYRLEVARSLCAIQALGILYIAYFVVTSFSISAYAHAGRWKEYGLAMVWVGFLVYHNWFSYAYSFYVCQANVMLLACFLYNFFYWFFLLILWDDELETYLENQVDLANKGRENFTHTGDKTTIEEALTKGDAFLEERKKENQQLLANLDKISSEGLTSEEFRHWIMNKSSRYIDLETLELHGEFAESNVFENIADLDSRYKKHVQTFYLNELENKKKREDQELKKDNEVSIDEVVDFDMVNYFLVYPIRWWDDVRAWKRMWMLDKIRVIILKYLHRIYLKQFFVPKVVGPYSLYSPLFKVKASKQEDWIRFKFLVVLKWLFNKIWMFFSLIQRYHNWRWFLFANRFLTQRKKLIKKRKTLNYRFFKNKNRDNT